MFVKRNNSPYSDWLIQEAKGLELLRQNLQGLSARLIQVPNVIEVSEQSMGLEQVILGAERDVFWRRLAQGLAGLHSVTSDEFGLGFDNYIGLTPQVNTLCSNWGRFFFESRLLCQANRIRSHRFRGQVQSVLEALADPIMGLLNDELVEPSLVHGDLWRGNVLCDEEQTPWLIDPACYFGDAETDLAMAELFGGFPQVFFDEYHRLRPRSATYEAKSLVYQLYHLMNHYNIFGDHYYGDVLTRLQWLPDRLKGNCA